MIRQVQGDMQRQQKKVKEWYDEFLQKVNN